MKIRRAKFMSWSVANRICQMLANDKFDATFFPIYDKNAIVSGYEVEWVDTE